MRQKLVMGAIQDKISRGKLHMAGTLYEGARKWVAQTVIYKRFRDFQSAKKIPKYSTLSTEQSVQQQKSIVFLCPATDMPIGGVKVIYNQGAVINEMNGKLAASILHPLNTDFSCTWFASSVAIKQDLAFNISNDFVMIPEFWAVPHARLLHKLGVRYGIYVQNGYSISFNAGEELDAAYRHAALILAISDDSVECIKLAFPECAGRVHRVHCSVNVDKFIAAPNKQNIICYMPRKLKRHSQLVTFFLNKKIPLHWRIESIDGLNEDSVASILGKSKIFLSFSEFEGLSLPPIEAALSGCHVIGYTGEAAKEYWDKEIFTEIHCGDIKAFVNAILNKIDVIDSSVHILYPAAINKLANRYSAKVELIDMQFVSNKIFEILNNAAVE